MLYECMACGKAQSNGKGHVCDKCFQDAPYKLNTNVCIGYLLQADFYCEECIYWFCILPKTKVYSSNIGVYSQVCSSCHKAIYAGSVTLNCLDSIRPLVVISV